MTEERAAGPSPEDYLRLTEALHAGASMGGTLRRMLIEEGFSERMSDNLGGELVSIFLRNFDTSGR